MKKETQEQAIIRRQNTYGCNGRCYQQGHMCGGIDTCEETRIKEGFATILSTMLILVFPIIVVIVLSIIF